MNDADTDDIADGFAAIGSRARLTIIKLLVRAGSEGLSTGDIQQRTGVPASTVSHHLRALKEAGLMEQQKVGRWVVNRADFDRLESLAQFLMSECCAVSVLPGDHISTYTRREPDDTHSHRP
ncbi:MAG: metalloregulator ArsR/SmtB family transcription factor [Pseudomonadota bacterium]